MDELDDDLKRRISEVFENFDGPSADEGWLLLRQRYPEEEKKRGIIWLWTGIAAAVLLLLGIGLYLFNGHQPPAQPQIAAKHQAHKNQPESNQPFAHQDSDRQSLASAQVLKADSGAIKHDVRPGDNTPPARAQVNKPQYVAATAAKNNHGTVLTPVQGKNNNIQPALGGNAPAYAQNVPKTGAQQGDGKPDAGLKTSAANNNQPDNGQSVTDQQQPVIAMNQPSADKPKVDANSSNNQAKTLTAGAETPKKQPHSIFDEPDKANAMAYKDVDKKPLGKAVHFGIYATTYFNYAKGSSNQVNVGAGLSSDIRLAGRLKLSTGLAVTQNSLYYGNQPSIPTVAAAAAPQALTFAVSSNAASFFGVNNSPTFRNYNASMVNLDVPLNLKYDLGSGKHGFFVAAGVSSGTFINETYIYNYNTPGLFAATEQQSSKSQTNTQNFSNFYLARVLNMSFGVGFPMGNGNHLSVEPFVKYPLQGLGAEQIKFGSGGVNLKFNFSTFKR